MRICQLIHSLIYAALLSATSGCLAFQSYRPEAIEVRDPETNKPIAGAEVRISYPLENSPFSPRESKAFTGADGIARVQAIPYGRAGLLLEVSANGYTKEQKFLTVDEVQAVEPKHWFEDVNRRPANMIMQIYAKPEPTIELVVPAGFRGEVKARVEADAGEPGSLQQVSTAPPQFAPGQRLFSYVVPQSGTVEVIGHPLFRHVAPANIQVKFADNAPLSRRAKETPLGYWWLKCENKHHIFLVGTQVEFEAYRRSLQSTSSDERRSSNSGQGRRGHRGRQPAD